MEEHTRNVYTETIRDIQLRNTSNQMKRARKRLGLDRIVFLVLVSLGLMAYLLATRLGIGLSPDSAQYISAARSLVRGEGISFPAGDGTPIPITLWPPMYPIVLAAPVALGINIFVAARWLGAMLYVSNAILVFKLISRATNGSRISGLLGMALFFVSVDILAVHTWAWSEGLFLFMGLGGIYFCLRYLETNTRADHWLAVGLLAGATLTRYPGVAFLAGASFAILLYMKQPLGKRMWHTIVFLVSGMLPVSLWMLRNLLVTGNAVSRTLDLRGVSIWELKSTLHAMTLWLIPGRFEGEWRIVAVALGICGLFLLAIYRLVKNRKTPSKVILDSSVLMVVTVATTYVLIVLFAKLFMEPNFPLDDPRYLAPLIVFILLLGILVGREYYRMIQTQMTKSRDSKSHPIGQIAVLLIVAYFISFNLLHQIQWVQRTAGRGQGYASKSWQESTLLKYVKELPGEMILFTNGYDVITLLLDRPAYRMPLKLHASPERREIEYDEEIAQMAERLKMEQGLLIYFNGITWRRMTTDEDIKEQVELELIFRTPEGAIYESTR